VSSIAGADAGADALDGRIQEFRSRATAWRQRRIRANLSAALVVADVAMALLVALNLQGPVRLIGGLAFCVVVPGWAIVGPMRLNSAPLEMGLAVAAGLSALMVVAQLASTLGLWHLTALQLVVCALCLPSLGWQALGHPRVADSGP
jgi:uncharacterized membrane protein